MTLAPELNHLCGAGGNLIHASKCASPPANAYSVAEIRPPAGANPSYCQTGHQPLPNANKIQYYEESETYCGLTQDQKTKAEKFLEHIEYKDGVFLCHPIPGYNVRTRILARDKELGFSCSCQGFKTKQRKYEENPVENPKPYCSHVGALKLWFVERNRKLGYGPFKQTKIEG